jgi:23S rRNA (cytosine1962-C5)-methyltransferase
MRHMTTIPVEYPTDWQDYELIDTGLGDKLERFGNYELVRPDPRIMWNKSLSQERWDNAHATYKRTDPKTGDWEVKTPAPDSWKITYDDLTFLLRPTEFKHVGVFPEQAVNWRWIKKTIAGRSLNILNLFAYTGGATMAALAAGARVTHVDAAKSTLTWAHDNAQASGLDGKPVRWIEDDAYKFVIREAKRGNTYDGVIMDPPRFGRGSKGEVWKLENDLPKLMQAVRQILSSQPSLLLINAYTADISSVVLSHATLDLTHEFGGTVTAGELALEESSTKRLLPSGIFARWSPTL